MKRPQRGNPKSEANSSQESSDKKGKEISVHLHISPDFETECELGKLVATFLGVTVLLIYVNTSFPTVPSGDSGELCFNSCALGVAHPPGYPLFIMIGFLFTKIIPIGTPAFRVNCVSCCCGALSGKSAIYIS